ncbi:hypothetical protein HKD37_12G033178 [Glycine soja]|nr:hypothetical protein JHK87_032737 [Glycine soja]
MVALRWCKRCDNVRVWRKRRMAVLVGVTPTSLMAQGCRGPWFVCEKKCFVVERSCASDLEVEEVAGLAQDQIEWLRLIYWEDLRSIVSKSKFFSFLCPNLSFYISQSFLLRLHLLYRSSHFIRPLYFDYNEACRIDLSPNRIDFFVTFIIFCRSFQIFFSYPLINSDDF